MPSVSRRYGRTGARFERPSGHADIELTGPVILMVSGGADSTALLVLAATSTLDIDDGRGAARLARERLHVLHVNHGLRGLDAEEDEEFVRDLAARYGIPCTIRRADVAALAASTGDNVENAGRELRYAARTWRRLRQAPATTWRTPAASFATPRRRAWLTSSPTSWERRAPPHASSPPTLRTIVRRPSS